MCISFLFFNCQLLKATRDNTKLRRQLKIVTAIMLIPGRNRNTQESSPPSNQPKVTTRSSQNGPSDVPVPETSIDVSVENDKPSNSALPSPARTCQNTTSVVTLPSVTVSLSSPSSLSSSSSSSSLDTDSSSDATEQLGGRNTDVTVTAPSVISRNDHLPIESTSLVTNCTASVRNQSSPYLSGDSISPASVTTSKETSSKHQCDENSLMMRTITSSQSPCSSSSFTNTSNSLCQSQSTRDTGPLVLNKLSSFSSPNERLAIVDTPLSLNQTQRLQSEADKLPGIIHPASVSSEMTSTMVQCYVRLPEGDISPCSASDMVTQQSTSAVPITNSSENTLDFLPVNVSGGTLIQAEQEVVSMPLSRDGDNVSHEGLIQADAKLRSVTGKTSSGSVVKIPARNKKKQQSPSSSVRAPLGKNMSGTHLSAESSSRLLMSLATKVMERALTNARKPEDTRKHSAGLSSKKTLKTNSNTRGPLRFVSGDPNTVVGRGKSVSDTVKKKTASTSKESSTAAGDGDVVHNDGRISVSSMSEISSTDRGVITVPALPLTTASDKRPTDSIVTSTNISAIERPSSLLTEDLDKLSTTLSNQIKDTLATISSDSPLNVSLEASDSFPGQSTIACSQSMMAGINQQEQTRTEGQLCDDISSVRDEPTVQVNQSNDCVDAMSLDVNQREFSNSAISNLGHKEQSSFNLLDAGDKSSNPEKPCEPADRRVNSEISNQARKRALTKIVDTDFEALSPGISSMVASSSSSSTSSCNGIPTPIGTGTSLFSSDGTIESLLDLREYDLSSVVDSLSASDNYERSGADEIPDTESLLELFERTFSGGGQDMSVIDQLSYPSILEEREERSDFPSYSSQLSSIFLANSDNEQSLHERDNVLIDIANFCDNNISPLLTSASPSHSSNFLSILREMEDNQTNIGESLSQASSHLRDREDNETDRSQISANQLNQSEAAAASRLTDDNTLDNHRGASAACSPTLEINNVNSLLSELREGEKQDSRRRKHEKRKGKKRSRSRERSRKPKKKKRKRNGNTELLS